jgi:signal transduction histidine kinase
LSISSPITSKRRFHLLHLIDCTPLPFVPTDGGITPSPEPVNTSILRLKKRSKITKQHAIDRILCLHDARLATGSVRIVKMYRAIRILLPLAGLLAIGFLASLFARPSGEATSDQSISRLSHFSVSELADRLASIDGKLSLLAQPSMRTGVGAVGYRSKEHSNSENTEWIQIDLGDPVSIDQVVLVPTIWRDTAKGFRADGFPLEFRIIVGQGDLSTGKIVAAYGANDSLLPRIAPVVIDFPAMKATWVRLEAIRLTPRGWDGMYLLQLSEIFVFSDQENVALQRPVETSSSDDSSGARRRDYVVDGSVPYLMDASEGQQSLAFVSNNKLPEKPFVMIDLGQPSMINRIHVHATDRSDTVPQSVPEDFGIPRKLVIEGANKPDFADAVVLTGYQMESVYDAGPIIIRRFAEASCRYVRLVAIEPYLQTRIGRTGARIGFAEIELFSDGRNVALGKPVTVNFDPDIPIRVSGTLTDGKNLFGNILPTRQWMAELSLRHDLEVEQPVVRAELNRRFQRQRRNMIQLAWLAGLLALIAVFTILIERIIRQRAIFRTRERIAADIHDELGANLHAIGLLGDLAHASADSPDRLKSITQQIRALTERSGDAARYCSNMLESKGMFGDLMEDMQRSASRIMADLEHEISFEGEQFLRKLKPPVRIDLFLFYKECLTNILRHSNATRVTTKLTADQHSLCLMVADNGCGLSDIQDSRVPKSLSRRARLIGAKVSTAPNTASGTIIKLTLQTKKFGLISRKSRHE